MKKVIISGLAAAAVAGSLSLVTAPTAGAWCSDKPAKYIQLPCLDKPSWPSFPTYNMGGPRPPLADKNGVWCTSTLIASNVQGVAWERANHNKQNIQWWPDYYHNTFVTVVWNNNGGWVQAEDPQWTSADCDA
jgi:hypothetical protein